MIHVLGLTFAVPGSWGHFGHYFFQKIYQQDANDGRQNQTFLKTLSLAVLMPVAFGIICCDLH